MLPDDEMVHSIARKIVTTLEGNLAAAPFENRVAFVEVLLAALADRDADDDEDDDAYLEGGGA